MSDFVKKPCKSCPFRNDITPFLTPERAEEIAMAAYNPYNDFLCHNTFEYDGEEDHQGRSTGDFSRTKTCAGFLTMRAQLGENAPDGFEPSYQICYADDHDMIEAHKGQQNNK